MIYDYKDYISVLSKNKKTSVKDQKLLRKIMEWKKIDKKRGE